ncbi:DUF2142 domain-containing protein [Bifidobacterium stellenboschense]|nr:DUF2142 domain-containing protein [Bifidobacterium stellenboschense]
MTTPARTATTQAAAARTTDESRTSSGLPETKTPASRALQRLLPLLVAIATLIIGGAFMAATTPGHTPDIWAHVYRIDGILNGDVLARPVTSLSKLHNSRENVGGHVDWEWIDYSHKQDDGYDPNAVLVDTITASDGNGADVPYNNTAINSPIAYLPQLAAFALGKLAGIPAQPTYYLAEAFMLAVYACCTAVAVALLPKWRIFAALIMLSQLMLYRYPFAISADSMTQAIAILLSCMLMRALYRRATPRYYTALAAVCLLLAMCKFVYAPLILLAPLIPWIQQGHGNPAQAKGGMWIPAVGDLMALGCSAFWMKANSWFVTTPMMVSYDEMAGRKHALLTDAPFMWRTIKAICLSAVTGHANLNVRSDTLIIRCGWIAMLLMGAMLLAATIAATVRHTLRKRETVFWWCACIIIIGIILLTYLALWLQYTPSGSAMVEGMQYRYFLPMTVLGGLCFAQSASTVFGAHVQPAQPKR